MQAITSLRKKRSFIRIVSRSSDEQQADEKANDLCKSSHIPFLVLAGKEELDSQKFTLKNMAEGSQETVDLNTLIKKLKN